MQQTRMVRLATVRSTFHARVIAARLGAEGMVTELRGNVDGIYPVGDVHVFVTEEDLEAAQELLMADEVESAFDEGCDHSTRLPAPPTWVYLAALLLLATLALATRVS
jgi:hypothetical protein